MPRDAKHYNKLLNDETQYYKDYELTYNNKRDVIGIFKKLIQNIKNWNWELMI